MSWKRSDVSKRAKPPGLETLAMFCELSGEEYIRLSNEALQNESRLSEGARKELSSQMVQRMADYWRKRKKQM